MDAARPDGDARLREMKREARRLMRGRLAAIPAAERREWSAAASRMVLDWARAAPAGCWLVFASMQAEIDTVALIEGLLSAGRLVALPRLEPDGVGMRARRIESMQGLEVNRWGIREPVPHASEEVAAAEMAVIVTPGLAFDREGARLGRGRGYYDRFLRAAGRAPVRIGFFFALQELDQVPAGPGDERLDRVVTEREFLDCGKGRSAVVNRGIVP